MTANSSCSRNLQSISPPRRVISLRAARLLCLSLLLSVFVGQAARGANVQTLHQFSALRLTDAYPSPLIAAPDGYFYGTSVGGGDNGKGAVIKVSPTGATTILYSFGPVTDTVNNINADGFFPNGGVILGKDGNFYGTTGLGGPGGSGTVYKITAAGALTTLHNFAPYTDASVSGDNPDGLSPNGVIQGADGNFYGTTRYGGANGNGVIFKMIASGAVTVLHDFSAEDTSVFDEPNGDGANPLAGLCQGADGNFYGAAQYGGSNGDGTVFRISPSGVFALLHSFSGADGQVPTAHLTQGTDGNFYGSTSGGGDTFDGTVFRITPDGTLTSLHSFSYTMDGSIPAPLFQGADGNFYGTAASGGAGRSGTIFRLTPGGDVTVLHAFSDDGGEGSNVNSGVLQDQNGDLRGVTFYGGAYGSGTLFDLTAGGVFSVQHDFGRTFNAEGASSIAALVQGPDGSFYGTAQSGGFTNNGTVFKIDAVGTVTNLHDFSVRDASGNNADGVSPQAGLILGQDGNFYGTTHDGGVSGSGTIFKVTPAGEFTLLHSFTLRDDNFFNEDGATSSASLVQGADGSFYGTAILGGANGNGTIFKITPGGVFTTLYSFSALDDNFVNLDGRFPVAGLVQGKDGSFYGTTLQGGANGSGAIFKVTSAGAFTSLYNFDALNNSQQNKKGANPFAALVQARDGSFYGTTQYGGINGTGTIFAVTAGGTVSTLHSFGAYDSNFDNADGASPVAALTQGRDGSLYGSAQYGGANGSGTLFKVNAGGRITSLSGGKFTTLYSFSAVLGDSQSNADGAHPDAPLVQGVDGNFYGMARDGGLGLGTVFKFTPITFRLGVGSLQSEPVVAASRVLVDLPGAHLRGVDLVERARLVSPFYVNGARPSPLVVQPARTSATPLIRR